MCCKPGTQVCNSDFPAFCCPDNTVCSYDGSRTCSASFSCHILLCMIYRMFNTTADGLNTTADRQPAGLLLRNVAHPHRWPGRLKPH